MARGVRLTGYRSRIVLSSRGRIVANTRSTVITTTLREAFVSGLRSLAAQMARSDADTAVLSFEWFGPVELRASRVHPAYAVTLALPPPDEPSH